MLKFSLFVFFLIHVFALSAQTKEEYLSQGEGFYAEKEYEKAIYSFSQAIEAGDNSSKTFLLRGTSYMYSGDLDAAKEDLLIAKNSKDENSGDALFYLGIIAEYEKDFNQAAIFFSNAIEQKPDNQNYIIYRAVFYSKTKEYGKAIADYELFLEKEPNDLLALSNLALNLLFIGEYEEALKKYSEVNEINPKYLKADDYQNIGLAHYKLGKLDDALLNCNKSIRLKSNEQSVYNTRGLIYVAQNKMEEALADFTSAIELEPEFQMAILNRAILFHLLGDETKSYADFMTAKEQGCNCYGVAFGEGIYFLKEKKYEDARKSFVKAIEIYEEQILLSKGEICYYLAITQMELKNQHEACEYFSLAKSLNFTKENKKLQKFCAKN